MDGMEEWTSDINQMIRRVKPALKDWVDKTSNKAFRGVVLKTPVGKIRGGTLRRNWKNKSTGDYERVISNQTKYGSYVENGHRVVRNGKVVGYVEGRYMLKRTIDKIVAEMDGDLNITIDEITGR